MRKKKMKTNKELNQEYDQRQQERVRPKQPEYNFAPLEEVVRQWITRGINTQHE
jgi:hypothetical protein